MIGDSVTLHDSQHLTGPVLIPFLAKFAELDSEEQQSNASASAFPEIGTLMTKVRRETTDDR